MILAIVNGLMKKIIFFLYKPFTRDCELNHRLLDFNKWLKEISGNS